MNRRKFGFVGVHVGVKSLTEAKAILGKKSVDNLQVGHSIEFQGVDKKERNPICFKVCRFK